LSGCRVALRGGRVLRGSAAVQHRAGGNAGENKKHQRFEIGFDF